MLFMALIDVFSPMLIITLLCRLMSPTRAVPAQSYSTPADIDAIRLRFADDCFDSTTLLSDTARAYVLPLMARYFSLLRCYAVAHAAAIIMPYAIFH